MFTWQPGRRPRAEPKFNRQPAQSGLSAMRYARPGKERVSLKNSSPVRRASIGPSLAWLRGVSKARTWLFCSSSRRCWTFPPPNSSQRPNRACGGRQNQDQQLELNPRIVECTRRRRAISEPPIQLLYSNCVRGAAPARFRWGRFPNRSRESD